MHIALCTVAHFKMQFFKCFIIKSLEKYFQGPAIAILLRGFLLLPGALVRGSAVLPKKDYWKVKRHTDRCLWRSSVGSSSYKLE